MVRDVRCETAFPSGATGQKHEPSGPSSSVRSSPLEAPPTGTDSGARRPLRRPWARSGRGRRNGFVWLRPLLPSPTHKHNNPFPHNDLNRTNSRRNRVRSFNPSFLVNHRVQGWGRGVNAMPGLTAATFRAPALVPVAGVAIAIRSGCQRATAFDDDPRPRPPDFKETRIRGDCQRPSPDPTWDRRNAVEATAARPDAQGVKAW